MIAFQNVSKYYDLHTVLRNINITIQKGEMAFLTGPSGAGKSTLLRLMYMAELADEGNIIIEDLDLASLKMSRIPFLRRSIGVVFQDFKLIKNLNVFNNVALALRIRGVVEREARNLTSEALKKVNLRHLADSYPQSLSGGEQQRVAIARAIVADPLVILADEPTGNLDPGTALDIIKLFRDLNLQGTTVLIATHNRELFRGTGKRVFKLDGGTLSGEEVG
ncbi:MAG: cell division ATP-binding protein FtsE [Nitrospirae bacterium]|nr:cell division ATP-binding protein FtsE [Nitrospirota bacterium]MCL5236295.1 cell division ATP-binding protein FtsE [Nitrospirota bacterium]